MSRGQDTTLARTPTTAGTTLVVAIEGYELSPIMSRVSTARPKGCFRATWRIRGPE
jgi:hypothetical protein